MIVMKFGGTSVAGPEQLELVSTIVHMNQQSSPIVITSAPAGVTNLLQESVQFALTGHAARWQSHIETIKYRFRDLLTVIDNDNQPQLIELLTTTLTDLTRILRSIETLGEATLKSYDSVLAIGELLMAPFLAGFLRSQGLPAGYVDARQFITTDNVYGNANPLSITSITQQIQQLELPGIPIIPGFIAATQDGQTTTLGRGGSDYTAALIAAAIQAEELQIWTDVNGVMSANPRICPDAYTITHLSYQELAELSYWGAKVVYFKTIAPAAQHKIPITVRNTFNSGGNFTPINSHAQSAATFKAISAISDVELITISGASMQGTRGIAARIFTQVALAGGNIIFMNQTTSEQSISFAIEASVADEVVIKLQLEFSKEIKQGILRLEYLPVAIVSTIGTGMCGHPGTAGQIFTALGDQSINIITFSQSPNEMIISIVISPKDLQSAVNVLHYECLVR